MGDNFERGERAEEQYQFGRAYNYYSKAVESDPTYPLYQVKAGAMAAIIGKEIEAIDHFTEALRNVTDKDREMIQKNGIGEFITNQLAQHKELVDEERLGFITEGVETALSVDEGIQTDGAPQPPTTAPMQNI